MSLSYRHMPSARQFKIICSGMFWRLCYVAVYSLQFSSLSLHLLELAHQLHRQEYILKSIQWNCYEGWLQRRYALSEDRAVCEGPQQDEKVATKCSTRRQSGAGRPKSSGSRHMLMMHRQSQQHSASWQV